MLYSAVLLVSLLTRQALATGTPFGYATGAFIPNLSFASLRSVLKSVSLLFLQGTTGGGSAEAAEPTSNAQLVSWLGDSTARTIVLTQTFDFTGTAAKG